MCWTPPLGSQEQSEAQKGTFDVIQFSAAAQVYLEKRLWKTVRYTG